jgi:hypothetical protein
MNIQAVRMLSQSKSPLGTGAGLAIERTDYRPSELMVIVDHLAVSRPKAKAVDHRTVWICCWMPVWLGHDQLWLGNRKRLEALSIYLRPCISHELYIHSSCIGLALLLLSDVCSSTIHRASMSYTSTVSRPWTKRSNPALPIGTQTHRPPLPSASIAASTTSP